LEDAEQGTFIANILLPGNFEMAFFLNLPYDDPDRPLSFYHTTPRSSGFLSGGNYSNPELDKLIEAQAAEQDENKRREIVLRAQRLAIQGHGPQITLPSGYAHYARRSHIHYPYEIGEAPSLDAGPWGADIWTEEA
jgi:ABC-type transport system substrate-binding protein